MDCRICGAACEYMGSLGKLDWFICPDCGMQQYQKRGAATDYAEETPIGEQLDGMTADD